MLKVLLPYHQRPWKIVYYLPVKYIPFVEKYHVEWHISDLKISILKIIHNSTLHAAIVLNTVGDDILQAAMFPKRILL